MLALILAILSFLGGGFFWFMISMSDPSSTEMSRDAANHALWIGLGIGAVFLVIWASGRGA